MKDKLKEVPLLVQSRVLMPKKILHKIKYLCKHIPKVEWSGIILYEVVGSIEDVSTLQIVLKDILPMNKGNKTFTSYEFNEPKRDKSGYDDVHIDYCMRNPEALAWKVGHIHSHNSMNVFFSGTDMEELQDNAPSHDFYFSIIVNNWMDFCAKIAFVAKAEITTEAIPYLALNEKGETYTVEEREFTIIQEKLFLIDCDIESPKDKIEVDFDFATQVTTIINKEKEEAEAKAAKAKKSYGGYPGAKGWQKPKPLGTKHPGSLDLKHLEYNPLKLDNPFDHTERAWFADQEIEELTDIESFTLALLRGGIPADASISSIELALDEISAVSDDKVDPLEMAELVLSKFSESFIEFFPVHKDEPEMLVLVTEEVLELIENQEIAYPWLGATAMGIKRMLIELQKPIEDVR